MAGLVPAIPLIRAQCHPIGVTGTSPVTTGLRALAKQLKKEKVRRIDTAVVTNNEGAARFYARMGYRELGEERLAKVL